MATSVLPDAVDSLVALATAALPAAQVLDGPGVAGSPGDYLMINADNPDSEDASSSATIQQERLTMGSRKEAAEIHCAAYSWTGDSGNAAAKAARDAAFATVAAVENILRTTAPTLNVDAVMKTEFGERMDVSQAQTDRGADCLVIFSVAYLAQI